MKKSTTTFTLVMINVAAIGSLNNLPTTAVVGLGSIVYYVLAIVLFFVPYSLIVAELASAYHKESGIYIWVKEAFGAKWGFTAAWLQWIENLFWYPTILSFIAATLSHFVDPALASSKTYNLLATLGIYWALTVANLFGIRASAIISLIGSSLGILLPGILLIVFGCVWYTSHHPLAFTLGWEALKPNLHQYQNLAILVGIAQTLAGLEISAVHTDHVRNPQRAFPLATLFSTLLILVLSVLGSLSISALVPSATINLNSGVSQAFARFLQHFNVAYLENIFIVLITIGGMTAVSAWITGPSKSLMQAAEDHCIPPYFKTTNAAGVSMPILFTQGALVSLFCAAFIIMPTVTSAYWMLTVIAGQLYMVMYVLMFAAAIKLRKTKPSKEYAYRIGGFKGTWLVSALGSVGCISFITIGFIPPGSFGIAANMNVTLLQMGIFIGMILLPLWIYQYSTRLRPTSVRLATGDEPELALLGEGNSSE